MYITMFTGLQDGTLVGDSAESSLRAWPKPPDVSNEDPSLQASQGTDNTLYVHNIISTVIPHK